MLLPRVGVVRLVAAAVGAVLLRVARETRVAGRHSSVCNTCGCLYPGMNAGGRGLTYSALIFAYFTSLFVGKNV